MSSSEGTTTAFVAAPDAAVQLQQMKASNSTNGTHHAAPTTNGVIEPTRKEAKGKKLLVLREPETPAGTVLHAG
jgi:hypothetical protein